MGVVHRAMREAKQEYLADLSARYLSTSQALLTSMKHGQSGSSFQSDKEVLEVLESMYGRAAKMPIWPFNIETFSRFFMVTLIPIIIILLQVLLESLLRNHPPIPQ